MEDGIGRDDEGEKETGGESGGGRRWEGTARGRWCLVCAVLCCAMHAGQAETQPRPVRQPRTLVGVAVAKRRQNVQLANLHLSSTPKI